MKWEQGQLQASTALTKVFRCLGEDGSQAVKKRVEMSPTSILQDFHDNFTQSCQLQTGLGSQSEYWCKLYSYELDDSCFYYAEAFDCSVKDIISRRQRPSPLELYNITRSVLEGLSFLRQSKNRPHGNLKSANVLAAQGRYALTDPLPTKQLSAKESLADDLVYLGEMLVQLITHKRHIDKNDLDDPGWKTLGKFQKGWRQFCTELLNYDEGARQVDHEELLARLETLKPDTRPFVQKNKWSLSLAALTAVGLAIYFIFFHVSLMPWPESDWDASAAAYKPWLRSYLELSEDEWQKILTYGEAFQPVKQQLQVEHWQWFKELMAAQGNDRQFVLQPLKVNPAIHTNQHVAFLTAMSADLKTISASLSSWSFPQQEFSKLLAKVRQQYPLTIQTLPTLPASVSTVNNLMVEFARMQAWDSLLTERREKYSAIDKELVKLEQDIEAIKQEMTDLQARGESDESLAFNQKKKQSEAERFRKRFLAYKADFVNLQNNINARSDEAKEPLRVNKLLARLEYVNSTDLKQINEFLLAAKFDEALIDGLWQAYKQDGVPQDFSTQKNGQDLLLAAQRFHSRLDEIESSMEMPQLSDIMVNDKHLTAILNKLTTQRTDTLAAIVSSLKGVDSSTKEADIPSAYKDLLSSFTKEKESFNTLVQDSLFTQTALSRQSFYLDQLSEGEGKQSLKGVYQRWQQSDLVNKDAANWQILQKFATLEEVDETGIANVQQLCKEKYLPLALTALRKLTLLTSGAELSTDTASFNETFKSVQAKAGSQFQPYTERIQKLISSRQVSENALLRSKEIAILSDLVEEEFKTAEFIAKERSYLDLTKDSQERYSQFLDEQRQTIDFQLSKSLSWQGDSYAKQTEDYYQYISALASPWPKIEKFQQLRAAVNDTDCDALWLRYRQKNLDTLTQQLVDADKDTYRALSKKTEALLAQLSLVKDAFAEKDKALENMGLDNDSLSNSLAELLAEEKNNFLQPFEVKLDSASVPTANLDAYKDAASQLFATARLTAKTREHLSESFGSDELWEDGQSIAIANETLTQSKAVVARLDQALLSDIKELSTAEKSCLDDFHTRDYPPRLFPPLLRSLASQPKLNHLKSNPQRLLNKSQQFKENIATLGMSSERQQQILTKINSDLPKSWIAMYKSVGKGEESLFEKLLESRQSYKVDDFTSDGFRYNVKLLELQKKFKDRSSVAQAGDAALRQAQSSLQAYFNANTRAKSSELYKKVMALDSQTKAGADLDELNKVGPGKAGFALVQGKSTEESIFYRHKTKRDWQLVFHLVEVGNNATFLSAYEFSLQDLFNFQAQFSSSMGQLKPLLLADSELYGIRGFKVNTNNRKFFSKEEIYSWPEGAPGLYPYLKEKYDGTDLQVSLQAPVHQLPPEAMDFIARAFSCRLPRSSEWAEAAKSSKGTMNLRDPSWKKLRDIMSKSATRRQWVIVGIHDGDNEDPDSSDLSPATTQDDGFAYYMDVNAQAGAGKFFHLKGNVCELLKDRSGSEYKVGGGSAFSPKLYGVRDLVDDYSFADLGFRLAFDAPPMSPMALFRRYVLKASFMVEED